MAKHPGSDLSVAEYYGSDLSVAEYYVSDLSVAKHPAVHNSAPIRLMLKPWF